MTPKRQENSNYIWSIWKGKAKIRPCPDRIIIYAPLQYVYNNLLQ